MKLSIYYFSGIPFNFLKQRPQQLYLSWKKQLAYTNDIYFVQPPTTALRYLYQLLTNKERNVIILSKFNLEKKYKDILKKDSNTKKIAIVSSYIWNDFVSKEHFDLICYDYIDDLDVFINGNQKIKDEVHFKHNNLINKSDYIFVTADKLEDEIRAKYPSKKIFRASNGVDVDFFLQNKTKSVAKINNADRKTVGYVGAIFDWIDVELIFKTAKLLPMYDFILIGPVSNNNKSFIAAKPANVFFIGKKKYDEVPSYIEKFNVTIIPFKLSSISESTDPIKLYEYFAMGKPVVSTPMRQLEKYNNGQLLKTAQSADQFSEAVNYFMNNDTQIWQKQRESIAREHSWDKIAKVFSNVFYSTTDKG